MERFIIVSKVAKLYHRAVECFIYDSGENPISIIKNVNKELRDIDDFSAIVADCDDYLEFSDKDIGEAYEIVEDICGFLGEWISEH